MQQFCNSCDEYRDIVIESDCWSCVWARAEEATTERIIKLLEEHIPIEDNYNMESSCRGCDWEWAWNGEVNDSHEAHIIALIKGEK